MNLDDLQSIELSELATLIQNGAEAAAKYAMIKHGASVPPAIADAIDTMRSGAVSTRHFARTFDSVVAAVNRIQRLMPLPEEGIEVIG